MTDLTPHGLARVTPAYASTLDRDMVLVFDRAVDAAPGEHGPAVEVHLLGSPRRVITLPPQAVEPAECTLLAHDHTTPEDGEGGLLDVPIPMRCNDCGVPSHWDESIEDYRHDDPDAPECFLIRQSDGAACTIAQVSV